MCFVGKTNAWFTSMHKDGVQIIVNIGDLKLNLYQKFAENDLRAVYTYKENNKDGATEQKYVSLSQKIVPDELVGLHLVLKNEDAGSSAMYLRFKFELYARGEDEDVLIATSLDGVDAHFEYKEYSAGDVNSGFYYYKESTEKNSKNDQFEQNTTGINLMTYFKVEFESLVDASGNLINISSETVYIKLTIDASVTDWLSGASW